jgi:hypothetical protein
MKTDLQIIEDLLLAIKPSDIKEIRDGFTITGGAARWLQETTRKLHRRPGIIIRNAVTYFFDFDPGLNQLVNEEKR